MHARTYVHTAYILNLLLLVFLTTSILFSCSKGLIFLKCKNAVALIATSWNLAFRNMSIFYTIYWACACRALPIEQLPMNELRWKMKWLKTTRKRRIRNCQHQRSITNCTHLMILGGIILICKAHAEFERTLCVSRRETSETSPRTI